jgi:hypothetical protein
MNNSENTARKQRGKPFLPGQSGNLRGRPKGARNTTTRAVEALLDGEAEELTRKAIEIAKGGDLTALRLCLDRIVPPRKDRPITFDLPKIETAKDAASVMSAVLAAVAAGEMTPSDASEITRVLDGYVKAFEATELVERIERLERMDR